LSDTISDSDISKIEKSKYGEYLKYDDKVNNGEKLIQSYTKKLYEPLNKDLIKGEINEDTSLLEQKLNTALDKMPNFEGKVYRGIDLGGESSNEIREAANNFIKELENKKFSQFDGFTSTSQDINRAIIFKGNYSDVLLEIESKNGKNIQSLSRIKDLNGKDIEKEILFKSKSRFEYKGVETIEKEIHIKGEVKNEFSYYLIKLKEI
jgi:hypothetical protein